MLKMISALLMTALFVVVCLGAAQAQTSTPTSTPRNPVEVAARQNAAAKQTAAARPSSGDPTPTPTSTPRNPVEVAASQTAAARQTAVAGGAAGPGDGAPPSPLEQTGEQTGAVHTVGEGLFDVDAGATALHQMVHSPAATPAFRSICDLPANGPADVVACDLYKAAYRLRHGNPCRHNDEGEAVCLH